jgi:hypothetical protein
MTEFPEAAFVPQELMSKAFRLTDDPEPFWKHADALAAIDLMEKNGKVVYGLDCFRAGMDELLVEGCADFSAKLKELGDGDHPRRVADSCRWAREFLMGRPIDDASRFTITWE